MISPAVIVAGPAPANTGLRFVAPHIPMLVDEPPTGDGWLHEIKHDGYRTDPGTLHHLTAITTVSRVGAAPAVRVSHLTGLASGL